MNERKISIFCRRAVRIMGIIIVGYLFLQGLFTVCCIQRVTERTHYIENNVGRQIVGIVLFALMVKLLWTEKVQAFLNRYGGRLVLIILACVVAFIGFWVYKTQFWYASDMELIYIYAEKMLAGDYSGWQPGGYPYMCPHQNGLLLLTAFLQLFFSQEQFFIAFYVLNIIFYVITIIAILFSLRLIYREKAMCSLQGILMLCFLPYSFFCLMMYSNIISFGWACVSIALGLWYCRDHRLIKLAGSALCMAFAIIMKQNQLIIFIGLLILLVFDWFNAGQKKRKPAAGIAMYIAIVILGMQLPNWTIEQITGIEVAPGNSKWAYVTMGLMEVDGTPGWYNRYNDDVFARNNYDHDATAAEAQGEAVRILRGFMENPAEGWRFFNYKIASEWNNPTFECFNIQNARSTSLELPGFIKSTINDGGKINLLFNCIFDIFESIILFGVLLYLIAADDVGWDKLLFLVLFIGGFLFYIAWEAKAQYVVYYFLLLIPYALPGYRKLLGAGIPGRSVKWNNIHTGILILIVLIVFIALSNSQWIKNSFKIQGDTQIYYDYIYEYGNTFTDFRF